MSRNKIFFKNIVSLFHLIYLYICMNQKYFKHIFFLNIVFIIPLFLIISCKSSPKKEKFNIPEPLWVTDKKAVFPEAEYLAQLGTGTTAKEAQNNSIAELAAYFNTNVKSYIQGDTLTYSSHSGQEQSPAITERTIKSSVVTSTDLELFALDFSHALGHKAFIDLVLESLDVFFKLGAPAVDFLVDAVYLSLGDAAQVVGHIVFLKDSVEVEIDDGTGDCGGIGSGLGCRCAAVFAAGESRTEKGCCPEGGNDAKSDLFHFLSFGFLYCKMQI